MGWGDVYAPHPAGKQSVSKGTSDCNRITALPPSLTSAATNRAREGNSSCTWDLSAVEETTVLVFPTPLNQQRTTASNTD